MPSSKEYWAEYRKRPGYKEKKKRYDAKYYAGHKDKYLEWNKKHRALVRAEQAPSSHEAPKWYDLPEPMPEPTPGQLKALDRTGYFKKSSKSTYMAEKTDVSKPRPNSDRFNGYFDFSTRTKVPFKVEGSLG